MKNVTRFDPSGLSGTTASPNNTQGNGSNSNDTAMLFAILGIGLFASVVLYRLHVMQDTINKMPDRRN